MSIIKFVIDKELDIQNYLYVVNAYKESKKYKDFVMYEDESFLEELSKISSENEVIKAIDNGISKYYKKIDKLNSLAEDANKEWNKIEKDIIYRLEKIHKNTFPSDIEEIKGVLSSSTRCAFSTNSKTRWFAVQLEKNKYIQILLAIHELMHFMFLKYYYDFCIENNLTQKQVYDIRESFTVLINIEFADLIIYEDPGQKSHEELRKIIADSWVKNKDFEIVLKEAIEFVKNN